MKIQTFSDYSYPYIQFDGCVILLHRHCNDRKFLMCVVLYHSLANRHSCLTPAKNEGIDIDSSGPIAERMINQQVIFVYP